MKRLFYSGLIILAITIAGCSGQTEKTGSTGKAGSATVNAKTTERFTNENFSKVLANASEHKGAVVDIKGQVFAEPKKQGDVWQFQIYTDPKKSEGNTIVIGRADFEIKSDMFVEVKGTVKGQQDYENMVGGKISAPLIDAETVLKDSSINALAPTQNTVSVNQSQDQNGVVITLEKVEFAEPETRLYVKVKNNTNQKANVYSFSMKLTQGNQQYEPESKYNDADYPELKSELLGGIESAGLVVFPKVDYAAKQLALHAEASSENYDLNFNPYVFNVQW